MKHLYKRIIIIATYAVLAVAVIALTVTLILTINSNTKTVDELNSKNEQLQEELNTTKTKSDSLASQLESTKASLETQRNLVSKYQAAVSEYQSEAESWKNKYLSSDPDNVTYSYEFQSVASLLSAIKKNPTEYNGKQVKVFGTVIKNDNEGGVWIVDDDGYDFSSIDSSFDVQYHIWKKTQKEQGRIIPVVIFDDIQYTVVDTGDYVKMYGTVTISNGEIYLNNCEYSR